MTGLHQRRKAQGEGIQRRRSDKASGRLYWIMFKALKHPRRATRNQLQDRECATAHDGDHAQYWLF